MSNRPPGTKYKYNYTTPKGYPTSHWEEQGIDVFKCVLIHYSTRTFLAKTRSDRHNKSTTRPKALKCQYHFFILLAAAGV